MLFKAVIVFACSAIALGGIGKPSGPKTFKTGGKIVGGSEAVEGEIPWQVSLQLLGSHYCGGSIISENWIVTAAHCSGFAADYYSVLSGALDNTSEGNHIVLQVINHEEYDSFSFANDIAVWQVEPPFEWGPQTGPVGLLAQDTPSPTGTLTTVSGWGTTSSGGISSDVLLKVDVPIYDTAACDAAYSSFGGVPAGQICAGLDEGGVDSCQGDSGGPLYFEGNLHGVVSWGNGCAYPGYPGVYTEASAYRDWITQNTGV